MKQPLVIALLLLAANLFSQQTKSVESAKKSVSYMLDTVSVDTGFYLIEQVKEFTAGIALPKVTNNPYYFRDTTAFKEKIAELKKSSEFKLAEAQKKIEEAKQLNLEGELRLRQTEVLLGLMEGLRTPAPTVKPEPIITPDPTIKNKSKKRKKE